MVMFMVYGDVIRGYWEWRMVMLFRIMVPVNFIGNLCGVYVLFVWVRKG